MRIGSLAELRRDRIIPGDPNLAAGGLPIIVPQDYLNWIDFKLGSDPLGNPICGFNVDTMKPGQFGAGKEYMVSYTAGSDANAGTSWAAPLKTVSAALAKADWDIITIDEAAGVGGSNRWYGAEAGRRSTNVTRSGLIRTRNGGRIYLIDSRNPTAGAYVAQTWVQHSGGCFKTDTPPVGTGALAVDLKPSLFDAQGFPAYYLPAPDIATVIATPGTIFRDAATNTVYAHARDDRSLVGDQDLIICDSSNGFNWVPAVGPGTLFAENIVWVGGGRAFRVASQFAGRHLLGMKNCHFWGGSTSNVFAIAAGLDGYLQDCTAGGSDQDAFNYHFDTVGQVHPRILELRCKSGYTGFNGSGANNGSTTHREGNPVGGGLIVRALGTYYGSADRTLHDGGLYTWNFGCDIRAPVGPVVSTRATVRSGQGNVTWLDKCKVEHGASNDGDLYVEADGRMLVSHGMDLAGLTSVGTFQRYPGL